MSLIRSSTYPIELELLERVCQVDDKRSTFVTQKSIIKALLEKKAVQLIHIHTIKLSRCCVVKPSCPPTQSYVRHYQMYPAALKQHKVADLLLLYM